MKKHITDNAKDYTFFCEYYENKGIKMLAHYTDRSIRIFSFRQEGDPEMTWLGVHKFLLDETI